MGVRFRGGFLVGARCLDVVDVGGLGCEILVLLDAKGISMYVSWSVFGDLMSPVGSLSSVGSKSVRGRLRLLVCDVWVWWLKGLFVVR